MLTALVLWFFLGAFGAHRFYLGDSQGGSVMCFLWILGWLTCLIIIGFIPLIVVSIWWLIDVFLLVSGELKPKDGSKLV